MPKPKKHKRGKPKAVRSGCLFCKPQKLGHTTPSHADLRRAGETSHRGHGKGG